MKNALPLIGKIILVLISLSAFVIFALPFLLPIAGKNEINPTQIENLPGRFLTFDGYTAYVIEKNQTSKQTVVLLHGFGSNAGSWGELQNKLAKAGFRVIAMDLKGFGYSLPRREDDDYSHAAQATYVARVLSLLGVSDATVVGHSMGANIAVILSIDSPALVKNIALIDPALVTDDMPQLQKDILTTALASRWVKVFATYGVNRAWIQKTLIDANAGKAPSYTMIDTYYTPTTVEGWKNSLSGIVRDSSKNKLDVSKIHRDIPVLLLWGEKDTWVPVSRAPVVQGLFSTVTTKTYADVGHLPQEVIPDRVSADIILFIKK